VINAAGLYSDEIARMVNPQSEYVMNPIRGEATKFYKTRRQDIGLSGLNVYPTPYSYDSATGRRIPKEDEDKIVDKYPFVGVHLTPTFDAEGNISKTVTIGPFLTPGVGKEDYGNNLKAPDMFFDEVKRFFPGIRLEDIELHQAGILAKLRGNRDFVMERDKEYNMFYNLVGIDSPGLTSSLAIAKYVKKELFG
jgi:L-2-hydroxyglutarate oxidase LhgO